MRIKITGINDKYQFIRQASKVDGDVNISKGSTHLDGKSLLGILKLDMTEGVNVTYPKDAKEFETFLEEYKI